MIHDRVGLPDDELAELQRSVASLVTLADVVRWGIAQSPPRIIADVVIQDEFSHDVVLPWRDVFLVFDTT